MTTSDPAIGPIQIRTPRADEGAGMWQVAKATGTLDLNSSYLYLLLARDFADTCVVALADDRVIGFASGYRRPIAPDVVFLWQIGIHPDAQGKGLGKRLVSAFLQQPGAVDARWLETTISPSNTASQRLFHAMARTLQVDCTPSPCFAAEDFPDTGHEAELLHRIGPLEPDAIARLKGNPA